MNYYVRGRKRTNKWRGYFFGIPIFCISGGGLLEKIPIFVAGDFGRLARENDVTGMCFGTGFAIDAHRRKQGGSGSGKWCEMVSMY